MVCTGTTIFFITMYLFASINFPVGTMLIVQADTSEKGACCVPTGDVCPQYKYEDWMLASAEHTPRGVTPFFGACIFTPIDEEEIGCPGLSNMSRFCAISNSNYCTTKNLDSDYNDIFGVWKGTGAIMLTVGFLQLFSVIMARSCRRAPRQSCGGSVSCCVGAAVILLFVVVIIAAVGGLHPGSSGIQSSAQLVSTQWRSRTRTRATFAELTSQTATSSIRLDAPPAPCPFVNTTAESLQYIVLPWPMRPAWILLWLWFSVQFVVLLSMTTFACCECGGLMFCLDEKFEQWTRDIQAGR